MKNRLWYALAILALVPALASAQAGDLGGLVPEDDAPGSVGAVGASYKFDGGFEAKILGLIDAGPQEGGYGVYDGTRYYDVIAVVGRDDGDGRDGDEIAAENKASLVRKLELLGARNVRAAESLSFVTASIPVGEIPGFSLYEEVYGIGDGELPVAAGVDVARKTVRAVPGEISKSAGRAFNGSGVTVAVIDEGINSPHLNDRVVARASCDPLCEALSMPAAPSLSPGQNPPPAGHGTQVAGVLAATGTGNNAGMAPGVGILDAMHGFSWAGVYNALDWAHTMGADVANLSLSIGICNGGNATRNLLTNEAVDKGMVVVVAAGNEGKRSAFARATAYSSVTHPGCAHNSITVGGIDDRAAEATMYDFSGRGPAGDGSNRLVPHLVAPAAHIEVLERSSGNDTTPQSGTSFAAPQASAVAAMMLEARPDLTPAEVKAGLLLGANWTGPEHCTSSKYELRDPADGCSFARQPRGHAGATDAASLGILNNAGLGVLDASSTLGYASPDSHNIVSGYLDAGTTSREYELVVPESRDAAKVVLVWMAHPHGGIAEQYNRTESPPVADLGFAIRDGSGNEIISADSASQTVEFAVFPPPPPGNYTLTVSGTGLDNMNKPVQNYALASTLLIGRGPFSSNSPPEAEPQTVTVRPGAEHVIRIAASDPDGDALSFGVSRGPLQGAVSTAEFVTKGVSRVVYTADADFAGTDTFEITPYDGTEGGLPAVVTLVEESLPAGAFIANSSGDVAHESRWFRHADGPASGGSREFEGTPYPVSSIRLESVDMEGTRAEFVSGGTTYTAAVPPSGTAFIGFDPPVTISSFTMHYDGTDEEAAAPSPDLPMMSVGYAPPASCAGTGTPGASCPPLSGSVTVVEPALPIPDGTYAQDAASTVRVSGSGNVSSIAVSLGIEHENVGDLVYWLESPAGDTVTLRDGEGGRANRIDAAHTMSSHPELRTMAGSGVGGPWTLHVGDRAAGNGGTVDEWGLEVFYGPNATGFPPHPLPHPKILLGDDFESGLGKWVQMGGAEWRISDSPSEGVPPHPYLGPGNRVAHADRCSPSCVIQLASPLDLSGHSSGMLALWRFVDSALDRGEYLKVELYNGATWDTAYEWRGDAGDDDGIWHPESYDLAEYMGMDNFNIMISTKQNQRMEDVQVDGVIVSVSDPLRSLANFTAVLSDDRSAITLGFMHATSHMFDASDFELSHGSVTSVIHEDGSRHRVLGVSGVHPDAYLVLTYAGAEQKIGTGPGGDVFILPGMSAQASGQSDGARIAHHAGAAASGDRVPLDASGSSGTGALSYLWEQVDTGAPAVLILDADSAVASFDVPYVAANMTADFGFRVNMTDDVAWYVANTTVSADLHPGSQDPSNPVPDLRYKETVIFSDQFGGFGQWDDRAGWEIRAPRGNLTADDNNSVAEIDGCEGPSGCHLVMAEPLWMDPNYDVTEMSAYIRLDGISGGDGLEVDIRTESGPGAGPWDEVASVQAADSHGTWFRVAADLSKYMGENATVRIVPSLESGDTVIQIDDFRITGKVADRNPPVFPTPPEDVVSEATSHLGAHVPYDVPKAVDEISGPADVVCRPQPGKQFGLGTESVECMAIDASGNIATAGFDVTVQDTTPPVVVPPPPVVVHSDVPVARHDLDLGTPDVADIADPSPTISNDAPDTFNLGNVTVTWTATDASGNSGSAVQEVAVMDPPPLSITAPPYFRVYSNTHITQVPQGDLGTPVATGPAGFTISNDSPGAFLPGYTVVTWTATGPDGTNATDTQLVHLVVFHYAKSNRVLHEDFESGMGSWFESPAGDWEASVPDAQPPGYGGASTVARASDCSHTCTMTLKSPLDLSNYNSSVLIFDRYMAQPLGGSGHLAVQMYDGTGWEMVAQWNASDGHADHEWHRETVPIPPKYTTPGASIRMLAQGNGTGDGVMVDNLSLIRGAISGEGIRFVENPGDMSLHIEWDPVPGYDRYLLEILRSPNGYRPLLITEGTEVGLPLPLDDYSDALTFRLGAYDRSSISNLTHVAVASTVTGAAPSESYSVLPTFDGFDAGLDGWNYLERPQHPIRLWCDDYMINRHGLSHSPEYGGSALLEDTGSCFRGYIFAERGFTVPPSQYGHGVHFEFEHRSMVTGDWIPEGYNNIFAMIVDSHGYMHADGPVGYKNKTSDSGWMNLGSTTLFLSPTHCPCMLVLFSADRTSAEVQKRIYLDNVDIKLIPSIYSASEVPDSYGTLHVDEFLEMLSSHGSKVLITQKVSFDSAIRLEWEQFGNATEYTASIHPASDPSDVISDSVVGTQHTFVGLDPDTEYVVGVGVAGDDSTRTMLHGLTLSLEAVTFDGGLKDD